MKIQIMSDLHLEFGTNILDYIKPSGDVLVIAGDLVPGKSLEYDLLRIQKSIKIPIIYIPGNHEFYGSGYETLTKWMNRKKKELAKYNIHILDREIYEQDGVTFIGAIGWTDGSLIKNNPLHQFKLGFNDFRMISDFSKNDGGQSWGRRDIKYITNTLLKTKGTVVVITHHAPSFNSCSPEFYRSELNAFFLNNWDSIIEQFQPAMWIHGHVHSSWNYQIGNTKVICNPYGYQGHEVNRNFDPLLTISV